jgi:hypothetical protein
MVNKNSKEKRAEPKVTELVNSLMSFMDAGSDYGADFTKTPFSQEIWVSTESGHPHPDTAWDKLTEHFVLREALRDWEPVWKIKNNEKKLDRVRKVEPYKVDFQTLLLKMERIRDKLDSISESLSK